MNKTACFLTVDWEEGSQDRVKEGLHARPTGSSYVRSILPSICLNDAGWECYVMPFWNKTPEGRIQPVNWFPNAEGSWTFDADVIITQRWMDSWGAEVTRNARAAGQIVLADVDDHYWALPKDNPAYANSHPELRPDVNIEHFMRQLGACDAVIVSTVRLQKFLESRLDVPVYLRRNMIELDAWERRDSTLTGTTPRVGWSGGTAWRTNDLTLAAGREIGKFVNSHGLPFVHVGDWPGAVPAWELLGINHSRVFKTIDFCPLEEFPESLADARIDLGVIPMENSAFNHGKSCLKGMEFAASGIPFVASALPEYEWFGCGILAKTERDWRRGLEKLLDPEQRYLYARAALDRVGQESYLIKGQDYVNLFDDLVS